MQIIVFCEYLREMCIDLGLHQTNTKIIICPSYTYIVKYISPATTY